MSGDWNYSSGDWNITCDVCHKKIKASDSKKRWDGLIVCGDDYEERHSMDFLRGRKERVAVPFSRPNTGAGSASDPFGIITDTNTSGGGIGSSGGDEEFIVATNGDNSRTINRLAMDGLEFN